MWFRYNAFRSGVMVPPLGSGGAADRRVTNHDGWEFNGLPTIHTAGLDRNKLCGWRGGQPWWKKREGFWLFPCLFFSDTDKILNQNTNLWWLNYWWEKYGPSSGIQTLRSPGCLQHLFHVKFNFQFYTHILSTLLHSYFNFGKTQKWIWKGWKGCGTCKERVQTPGVWHGMELRRWRVKSLCPLCSCSFVQCEKLIGEISKAITTFNWANSSGAVTAVSRGTLLNVHLFFYPFTYAVINFTNFLP